MIATSSKKGRNLIGIRASNTIVWYVRKVPPLITQNDGNSIDHSGAFEHCVKIDRVVYIYVGANHFGGRCGEKTF
jgi:hypothetical protein